MRHLLLAGAALVLTASAALADSRGDGDRAHGAERRAERIAAMFDRFDADKDGVITEAEIEAARATRLAAADTNGDGALSAEEFTARAVARAAERAGRMFARFDADGDGRLSDAEMQPRRGGMMAWLDADKDGTITRDEAMSAKRGHHGRPGE
jgi:Ca2+-binding EF-hand superfamily protein